MSYNRANLSKMKKSELQEICTKLDLEITGLKSQLVDRIMEHQGDEGGSEDENDDDEQSSGPQEEDEDDDEESEEETVSESKKASNSSTSQTKKQPQSGKTSAAVEEQPPVKKPRQKFVQEGIVQKDRLDTVWFAFAKTIDDEKYEMLKKRVLRAEKYNVALSANDISQLRTLKFGGESTARSKRTSDFLNSSLDDFSKKSSQKKRRTNSTQHSGQNPRRNSNSNTNHRRSNNHSKSNNQRRSSFGFQQSTSASRNRARPKHTGRRGGRPSRDNQPVRYD